MTTAAACLRLARGRIEPGEAALLLAHLLGRDRGWLYAHGDAAVPAEAAGRFEALVARRAAGEPVAYLVGRRGFWRFDLAVTPDTLVPRPETELLVELALARIPADAAARVADLGTGSGAIALAIAFERPRAAVVATDRSAAALEVARGNAEALGLGNVAFRAGDWLQPLAGERFDAIASNPPYIADGDAHLREGDLRFEPRGALASGADGLDAIRAIVRDAPAHLHPGGWLLFEHGWDQGDAARALLCDGGFAEVDTQRDLEGRDRVTLGRARSP
ncbi:MAG TPA: peptide chain release factor N(5)-glutamine methyltransferase [Luteimonas sp.]|nr:peptide chain release factor N(5)-glutamine methyltransferase [Luteimonas sp.]